MKLKTVLFVLLFFSLLIPSVNAQPVSNQVAVIENIPAAHQDIVIAELSYNPQSLNVPDRPVLNIGVQELRDVAALYFKIYEAYIKASEDNQINASDITLLIGPAMLLLPAFSGATNIPAELANLTDDQIKILCLVANEYELGAHAQRAKQIFKAVLTLAQTFFVFKAAP